ncbi:MAG: TdeIII family type II restriction endonuclease [Ignavibacterium sp.]
MGLTKPQIEFVSSILKTSLRNKFKLYKPETNNMPFHYRLLGKDRMALYSFIQSLNTTFGTSIFEPVAVALAKKRFKRAIAQYVVGKTISEGCQSSIQTIMNSLTVDGNPDKPKEIEMIRKKVREGKINELGTVKVDLFLESNYGEIILFDIKTAKPNISNFKDFKRTLLEWAGIVLTQNPEAKIHTLIAIPYNPYEPKPYERWTLRGMLDIDNELKVAKEFWDFLGGEGAYEDLLDCFEKVGIEMREEIDRYFSRFK